MIPGDVCEQLLRSPYGSSELFDAVEAACDAVEAGQASYGDVDKAMGQKYNQEREEFERQWLQPLPEHFYQLEKLMHDEIDMALATLETADENLLAETLAAARARVTFLENLLKSRRRQSQANGEDEKKVGRLDEVLRYLNEQGPRMPTDASDALGITAGAFSSCISAHRELFINRGKGWLLTPAGKDRLKSLPAVPPPVEGQPSQR